MKVFWIHSYNTKMKGGGIFMLQQIDHLKKINVEVELVCVTQLFNPIKFYKQFQLYKNNYKNDIIHAQYGSGTGFFTAMLKARKKVLSIRGSDWFKLKESPVLKERLRSYIGHFFTSISLRYYDEIIVMSHQMRDQILASHSKIASRVHVVTDGIDLEKFYPMDKMQAKIVANLPQNKFIIGIGTIDESNSIKRVYLAKLATQMLQNKGLPVYLHVLTEIEHDFMNTHINACDMLLHTSIYEGWPNIVKEGLACNVPFVSTDVSDLSMIADEPSSGCYITPPSTQCIAEFIQKVYDNKEIECQKSLVKFIMKMEIAKSVNEIKQIYLGLKIT